jgi:hypothetical protein
VATTGVPAFLAERVHIDALPEDVLISLVV